jgi:hypothetical protein
MSFLPYPFAEASLDLCTARILGIEKIGAVKNAFFYLILIFLIYIAKNINFINF